MGQKNTGTTLRFWPDAKYFEAPTFAIPKLRHVLRAKAVMCAGLHVTFINEATGESEEWQYTGGVSQYLLESLGNGDLLPPEMFTGKIDGQQEGAEWALVWRLDDGERIEESYVNLIPTAQGGTHVNGLRVGPDGRDCANSASSAICCRAASSWRRKTCGMA